MSEKKVLKREGAQIGIALLITNLIIALLLGIVLIKDSVVGMFCNYAGGSDLFKAQCQSSLPATPVPVIDQVVLSRITSACVDASGLKMSIEFDQPLSGDMNFQIFSTGEDYFPSRNGISDAYEMNSSILVAIDKLDFIIPVEDMPAGAQIFGNIIITGENSSSQVAYFIDVQDCLAPSASLDSITPLPNLDGAPLLYTATCLESKQLMITFEFEGPVLGQYQASVADIPYQLASVASQPAMLFFFGDPPPQGAIVIKLISATDQSVVFEEVHTPPACGPGEDTPNNNSGGDSPSSPPGSGGEDDDGGDDGGDD